jgi:2-keto-3-deoxy-L-rhamnonate aldolase RhmA
LIEEKKGIHMWGGIRTRVLNGEVVYGTMVRQGRDPGATTLVGKVGFDFVFIDMEHGAYSLETVADLIRGAKSVGCAPIIRVPAAKRYFISRVLDAGAEGIMVPMTSTPEQAERVVGYAKFPPMGRRGVGLGNAQVDYAAVKASDFTAEANEKTLVIGQIENREGISMRSCRWTGSTWRCWGRTTYPLIWDTRGKRTTQRSWKKSRR